jgi:hypothetical protein
MTFDVKVPSKSNMQENFFFKLVFFGIMKVNDENRIEESESGSFRQRHGSADPDPHQNVMDPQHCYSGA